MTYQLGFASQVSAVAPPSVPVKFKTALLCWSPVPPLATVNAWDVPVIDTDVYPLIAFSIFSKLSFVLLPHVPAFAPVVWRSKFNIVESAILSPYPVGTTVHVFALESSTPFQIVSLGSPT